MSLVTSSSESASDAATLFARTNVAAEFCPAGSNRVPFVVPRQRRADPMSLVTKDNVVGQAGKIRRTTMFNCRRRRNWLHCRFLRLNLL